MNLLLAGSSGQLGQELLPVLTQLGKVTPVDKVAGEHNTIEMDLSNRDELEALLDQAQPDIVVNAAAYTAVDQAEDDARTAFRLNAELPAQLARWCKANDRLLVHYSTDYVFNGISDRPYLENDPTGPMSVYGESKLAGEWGVQASLCRHIMLRTSWVYSSHGSNFVLSMLRLARQRSELSIVKDQVGCPTYANNLAIVTGKLLQHIGKNPDDHDLYGLFHYSDQGEMSWYEFAGHIFEQAAELGMLHETPRLKPISSNGYPQAAKRPEYSVLNTQLISNTFNLAIADVQSSLRRCLGQVVNSTIWK